MIVRSPRVRIASWNSWTGACARAMGGRLIPKMHLLWAASVRHLLRHPAQLGLALLVLTLGVATIAAVDMATASSYRAFELSIDAVNGAATHEIAGGPAGIDEALYVTLKQSELPIEFAPIVEGYVDVGEHSMQLVGIDPFAAADFRGPHSDANAGARDAVGIDPTRWF